MARDPQIELHKQWLGYLQPQGLVVSPAALVAAQAYLNLQVIEQQKKLEELLIEVPLDEQTRALAIPSFRKLAADLLGWRYEDVVAGEATGIEAPLPEYHETLRPDWAVREVEPQDATQPWLLLGRTLPYGTDLDARATLADDRNWQASEHVRFERLLRESQVPIGILFNGTSLRLVYAPKGESSGHVTFPFAAMAEVAGRPILAGFLLLLDEHRLFAGSKDERLPALLENSRKFQNEVSTKLAGQVLEALHDLLRGFQSAHAASGDRLLADWLREHPDDIYGGLLTVILRLIFLLYAEDRGLLSTDPVYQGGYSLQGLFERLRQDANRNPDTMDLRFGAWARLLSLFRLVFDGGSHGTMRLPTRHGYLFHPDGGEDAHYQFLEGRTLGEAWQVGATTQPPRVSDGVVWRLLRKLMVLDGERISYRTLNVEQIGSVYETMMGFRLLVTKGPSLAIKPPKPHGAPAIVDLDELLRQKPSARAKWLKEHADLRAAGALADGVKTATAPGEVFEALGKKIDKVTPTIVAPGSMVLQPSDARRRSGSHYTPPQLTQPIVATTLRPVLDQLGDKPTPEQILELKVCDPAMGSGAFLVEVCRQLGQVLVKAWHAHGCLPNIPPDEDELLFAKRFVAQRCLYGVDKNPFAVALAKLSLWLETFAKEHAFTFLDHSLRCGDSLVGLSRKQIEAFHWDTSQRGTFAEKVIRERMAEVVRLRVEIRGAREGTSEDALRRSLRDADDALDDVRLIGDLVIVAFFADNKPTARTGKLDALACQIRRWLLGGEGHAEALQQLRAEVHALRNGERAVLPFHWVMEFPEVFDQSGFDVFVGNPPFLGGSKVSSNLGAGYGLWLRRLHLESHGNADLVAHFFRRAFNLLCEDGALGFITTNTISQGDTRSTGLTWLCAHGGTIYAANRRIKWPGLAAVIVSVVHAYKGTPPCPITLDGRRVQHISAFLFAGSNHSDPTALIANMGKSHLGSKIYGQGFVFADSDTSGLASSLSEMQSLITKNPRSKERIHPYIGGEEVNASPTQSHHRHVINFEQMSLEHAEEWPDLLEIVRARVKPERDRLREDTGPGAHGKKWWWQFQHPRAELYAAIREMDRVLVVSQVGQHVAFAFLSTGMVYSHGLVVLAFSTNTAFAVLQSRIHEVWARFLGSSMKDDLRYTPSDCFETFPFPPNFETDPRLEEAGKSYYKLRARLMANEEFRKQQMPAHPEPEGLTKTYNRFHNPDESAAGIRRLRELHAAMDRAVLDAYGWSDLQPTHEFILDYGDEGDEETGGARKRKKPWRYRWPDDFRDEVLARLLVLNQERAAEEALHAPVPKRKTRHKKAIPRKGGSTRSLFPES